jgi:hypothetical protein
MSKDKPKVETPTESVTEAAVAAAPEGPSQAELQPSQTPNVEGSSRRRLMLADGMYYPVVKTVRDKATGKIYDYVMRERIIEAGVRNEHGILERKRLAMGVCHKIPRSTAPIELKNEDRYEVVVE